MNYYLYLNDQTAGPYPLAQIQQMLAAGQVAAETPCCREGDSAWMTVAHFSPGTSSIARTSDRFQHATYQVRTQLFKLFGKAFEIYGPDQQLLFYSELKAFKLKEDIRVYSAKDKKTELLTIKARQILDISATYDIYDSLSQAKVGSMRRKGLKSLLRDEWIIMDLQDIDLGIVQEDSMLLALIRRFLTNLIPQKYHGTMCGSGIKVFEFKQNFNPFLLKLSLDFSPDTQGLLDRRLGLAAAVLLCAIEGRQSSE